ncbi:M48 family metalloprotease, partial [Acidaminococcus timonensis]
MDMKTKIVSSCMVGLLGLGVAFGAAPAPRAEAGGVLVDVLGSAIMGTMYRDQVMGVYKTYNNTEKGRQEWFQQMKKQEGVDTDEYLNDRLDTIMTNVEAGIRAVDPTVDKKPYNYFISPNEDANAYCTIGHNVNVYRGIFNLLHTDDEITVVLGHELGHGQKDHPIQGVKKSLNA